MEQPTLQQLIDHLKISLQNVGATRLDYEESQEYQNNDNGDNRLNELDGYWSGLFSAIKLLEAAQRGDTLPPTYQYETPREVDGLEPEENEESSQDFTQ